MALRNQRVMMTDGREVMMSGDEAKAYYNGLPRTDQGVLLIPGGNLVSTGLSKLGGPLSKYFANLFGTTARTTGKTLAKNTKNLANNFGQRVKNTAKLNKAKAGSNTIPNTIKESAARTRLQALRNIEKQQLANATKMKKVNDAAVKSRDVTRQVTAGSGTVGALATAEMLSDPNVENKILPNEKLGDNSFAYPGVNVQAETYKNSPRGKVNAKVDEEIRAEAIKNIKEKAASKPKVKSKAKSKIVDKPKNYKQPVHKTISSDPGYKDGYRVDNVGASDKLSVYNIMNADANSSGQGYEW